MLRASVRGIYITRQLGSRERLVITEKYACWSHVS